MTQNTEPDKYLSFPVESLIFHDNFPHAVRVVLPFAIKGNHSPRVTLPYASPLVGGLPLSEGNACLYKVFLPLQYDSTVGHWHLKTPDGTRLFVPDIEIRNTSVNGHTIPGARFYFKSDGSTFDFGFVYTKQQLEDYQLLCTPISLNRRTLASVISILHYLICKTAHGQKVLKSLWKEDVDMRGYPKFLSYLTCNNDSRNFLFTSLFLYNPHAHSLLLKLQNRLKDHQIELFNGSLSYNEEYNFLFNLLTKNTPIPKFTRKDGEQPADNMDRALYTSGKGETPYIFWA